MAAELAAVVLDVPGGDPTWTTHALSSIAPSTEILVVRQEDGPAGDVLDVFPLGTCYARNRGAGSTEAPNLLFLDSDAPVPDDLVDATLLELGRSAAATLPNGALAFRRADFVRAGGFDNALGFGTWRGGAHDAELAVRLGAKSPRLERLEQPEALAAARIARRWRKPRLAVRAVAGGGLAGLGGDSVWEPPPAALHLPGELRHLGPLVPLAASNPTKTHFLYASADDSSVVHLFVNPQSRLERSLAEREQIRARVEHGVPALRAVVPGRDCLWVVEEHLSGSSPPPSLARLWFPLAEEWLATLADPDRTPLEASPSWKAHASALRATAPPSFAGKLDLALELVGRLPSVAMHGDLQRRNLTLSGSWIGAVDWEGAWLDGIPGLDLLYLSLFAGTDTPDFSVFERLARGDDVASLGLRGALNRLDLAGMNLQADLLVMLATWAFAEGLRCARLGGPPPARVFGPLFHRQGPALAASIY